LRRLIVNADDFGISEGVNRGIIEAHLRGILTSTTLMVNMPGFEHGVEASRDTPTLGVGVHLNLTTGVPVLPPSEIPSLVGEDGRFLRLNPTLKQLTLRRMDLKQIEAELSAQVEKAMEAGVSPTHLDSHHHVHIHPTLQPIVIRIARRFGIRGIRCTTELGLADTLRRAEMLFYQDQAAGREHPRSIYLKGIALSLFGKILQWRARRAGLAAPDHFRGLLLGLAFDPLDLHKVLRTLPPGATELMCHPGYVDEELASRTSYTIGRDYELRALTDPANREILDQVDVRLINYSDLSL
jgi:hopanoid biosynthesis associated protein HpnK